MAYIYDGPSVKEKINLDLFSLLFIGARKFTPVYWGVKINLNLFSLPFIGENVILPSGKASLSENEIL